MTEIVVMIDEVVFVAAPSVDGLSIAVTPRDSDAPAWAFLYSQDVQGSLAELRKVDTDIVVMAKLQKGSAARATLATEILESIIEFSSLQSAAVKSEGGSEKCLKIQIKSMRPAGGRASRAIRLASLAARAKATLAAQALLDREARKAIARALEGDTTAMRLCHERILLPRKERPPPPRPAGPQFRVGRHGCPRGDHRDRS